MKDGKIEEAIAAVGTKVGAIGETIEGSVVVAKLGAIVEELFKAIAE